MRMRLRQAVATLVTVAALGALSGCSNPSNSGTGTPADTVTDSSATAPSSSSIGATPTQSSGG